MYTLGQQELELEVSENNESKKIYITFTEISIFTVSTIALYAWKTKNHLCRLFLNVELLKRGKNTIIILGFKGISMFPVSDIVSSSQADIIHLRSACFGSRGTQINEKFHNLH